MQVANYVGKETIEIGICQPIAPQPDEVQIQVVYGGICGTDLHIFRGAMEHRVQVPQALGHEISGVVSAIGDAVEGIGIGDRVAVMPLEPRDCPEEQQASGSWYVCDGLKVLGLDTDGGFQSYWTVPAKTVYKLPDHLSMQHGAMLEPLAVACHAVRRAQITPGETVVVLGGGPIGTLVALVARNAGGDVMISEINPFRVDLLRSQMGFTVVNPLEQDLKHIVMAHTDGAGCDVAFEVTGNLHAAAMMTELPRIHGRIMITGIFAKPVAVDLFKVFWREISLIPTRLYNHEDFETAIKLAADIADDLTTLVTDVRPLHDLQASLEEINKGGDVLKILLDLGVQ